MPVEKQLAISLKSSHAKMSLIYRPCKISISEAFASLNKVEIYLKMVLFYSSIIAEISFGRINLVLSVLLFGNAFLNTIHKAFVDHGYHSASIGTTKVTGCFGSIASEEDRAAVSPTELLHKKRVNL